VAFGFHAIYLKHSEADISANVNRTRCAGFGTSMNWMQLTPNTRQMPTILVVAVEAAEMQHDTIETSEIS
jgi:hypothetical protein